MEARKQESGGFHYNINMAITKIGNNAVPAGVVTQHVTETDLQPIKSDISALALREATNESSAAFNLPNQHIDTFATDTLGTKTNSVVTGGYVFSATEGVGSTTYESETSDRTTTSGDSTYTLTDTFQSLSGLYGTSGTLSKMIDGSMTSAGISSASEAYLHTNGDTATEGTHYMRFDLGSGNSSIFKGFKWWNQNNTTTYGSTDNWKIQGSNDGASWTDLKTFTWSFDSSNPTATTCSNSTAYRYIQITPNSSVTTSTATWLRQFVWGTSAITHTINSTGTAIQAANTVGSAKTKVGGTILYKDAAGTATLGTDLKIYFTCNGGSNWTEASSYSAITPVYSTGIKQVRLGETTCTSGTDVRYKVEWANQVSSSKETQLHGIGVNY